MFQKVIRFINNDLYCIQNLNAVDLRTNRGGNCKKVNKQNKTKQNKIK